MPSIPDYKHSGFKTSGIIEGEIERQRVGQHLRPSTTEPVTASHYSYRAILNLCKTECLLGWRIGSRQAICEQRIKRAPSRRNWDTVGPLYKDWLNLEVSSPYKAEVLIVI